MDSLTTKASYLAAALIISRRLPSLYKTSSASGSLAALLMLFLAVLRPYSQNTSVTLAGTALGLAWSFFKKSIAPLRWIVALGAAPVMAEAIRLGDADVPAVLAITLGLCLDQLNAASVILIMVTGGEALEERALDRAGAALHSLLERSPGSARLDGEDNTMVPANEVQPGTLVYVRNMEVFPVDGYLVSPELGALADERLLTGESVSVSKSVGDLVMAGSVNSSPMPIVIRAKGGWEDSILNQMRLSLHEAMEVKKSKLELTSTRLADGMTPFTVLLASLAFEYHSARGKTNRICWDTVLSILMSATPCPARIGVPIAMLSGMNVSSRVLGATLKSGDALENLSKCNVLCLDKTGTVTTGRPVLSKCYFFQFENSDTAVSLALDLLANLEAYAPKHVLADAILAKRLNVRAVDQITHFPGQGVEGVVDGKFRIKIGSRAFVAPPTEQMEIEQQHLNSQLVTYFSINQVQYGVLVFEDPIRSETRQLVEFCRNTLGMRVVLLSGDSSKHLEWCAQELGVKEFATCLPHEKVVEIRKLQSNKSKVIMIGDGANDSAALAAADVGISLDPSTMASESAQIVILNGDIARVTDLIRLSRHVLGVAQLTVRAGMFASGVQMLLAALGNSDPFVNAVLQEIVDLSSVLHSLRALSFK